MKEIITDVNLLSERCEEVDVRKENELVREITLELKNTLREHKDGVGLAAPQIGYNKRIFVINFNGDYRTFVNPIITQVKGLTLSKEGCLSLPGKQYLRPRHNDIQVIYQTPLGKTESKKLVGLAAEVFQHEIDHLDGLLLSDVGMEIPENFDSLTDDEKTQLIKEYMESLDLKQKEMKEEIKEDKDLKQMSDAIDFMEGVATGKVQLGEKVTAKKD